MPSPHTPPSPSACRSPSSSHTKNTHTQQERKQKHYSIRSITRNINCSSCDLLNSRDMGDSLKWYRWVILSTIAGIFHSSFVSPSPLSKAYLPSSVASKSSLSYISLHLAVWMCLDLCMLHLTVHLRAPPGGVTSRLQAFHFSNNICNTKSWHPFSPLAFLNLYTNYVDRWMVLFISGPGLYDEASLSLSCKAADSRLNSALECEPHARKQMGNKVT